MCHLEGMVRPRHPETPLLLTGPRASCKIPCCGAEAWGQPSPHRHTSSPILLQWGCWGACRGERGPGGSLPPQSLHVMEATPCSPEGWDGSTKPRHWRPAVVALHQLSPADTRPSCGLSRRRNRAGKWGAQEPPKLGWPPPAPALGQMCPSCCTPDSAPAAVSDHI